MSRKIKRTDCYYCYNEFYHSKTDNKKRCWMFENAEMKTGRMLHKDTLPKNYSGRWKLIPDCYIYQHGFVERKER